MKKGIIIFIILFNLFFCSKSEANYINNPDFESNTSNGSNNIESWFTYNCTTDAASAYGGNYGLLCEPTQTGGAIFVQQAKDFSFDIDYAEGKAYAMSFFAKKSGVVDGACEVVIGFQVAWQQPCYEMRKIFSLTPDWQYFEVPFAMPMDTEDIFFATSFNNSQQEAMFDNICLNEVPEPASWLLLITGFFGLFSCRNKQS